MEMLDHRQSGKGMIQFITMQQGAAIKNTSPAKDNGPPMGDHHPDI
jgi:hypothetical protein